MLQLSPLLPLFAREKCYQLLKVNTKWPIYVRDSQREAQSPGRNDGPETTGHARKVTGFFVPDSQHPGYPSEVPRIECTLIPLPQTLGIGYSELKVLPKEQFSPEASIQHPSPTHPTPAQIYG